MKSSEILLIIMAISVQLLSAEPMFSNGEKLIFPKAGTPVQMSSAVIVTKHNHVIVFDGGNYGDYEHLTDVIAQYGRTVDFWFLTHIHNDHCGALIELFRKEPNKLQVKKILYSFPEREWMLANEDWDKDQNAAVYDGIEEITWPKACTQKGRVYKVDGVTVKVLNNVYAIAANAGNNTSIAFMAEMSGKRLLVPGDIGIEGGDRLVEECQEDLQADIVMLSHHGQNGANKEFYAAVKPSIAIWETPQWLWDNDIGGGPGSGPWQTNFVKCWMQELGVKKQYRNWEDVILE